MTSSHLGCRAVVNWLGALLLTLSLVGAVHAQQSVTERSAVAPLRTTGAVEPNAEQTQQVTPFVSGRVERVHAVVGDYVKAGSTLAVISSPDVAEQNRNHPALVQCAPITCHRDRNRDGKRTGDPVTVDVSGLNWHGTRPHIKPIRVGEWSYACNVRRNWAGAGSHMELWRFAMQIHATC